MVFSYVSTTDELGRGGLEFFTVFFHNRHLTSSTILEISVKCRSL